MAKVTFDIKVEINYLEKLTYYGEDFRVVAAIADLIKQIQENEEKE